MRCFVLFACLSLSTLTHAQDDTARIKDVLRGHIYTLASPAMLGRGYVEGGLEKGAAYINNIFTGLKMKPPHGMGSFKQAYNFPVNTFPGKVRLVLNNTELTPGKDFLVDAGSAPYSCKNREVQKVDVGALADKKAWKKMASSFDDEHVWLLENTDSLCKLLGARSRDIGSILPDGCYLIPQKTKQMWTVSQTQGDATIFYVNDTLLPADVKTATVDVQARLRENMRCENIVAAIPGTVKDSFIVCSAHYDHLGKMGSSAIFPGASDNATGTAMLLYLASYYAAHPQRYTMVFIAFSGEEAGLLGSAHFVKNPPIPLENIKFLINTDIMGDATDGITVVNATEFPGQFATLTGINDTKNYIPVIKSRGKAANSDHYFFSEAGVPAIFIYSNGGKGYYHDIYDKPEEVTLNHVGGVALLLKDFIQKLQE